jgi:outer membrane receptor protein involved in Fe transport
MFKTTLLTAVAGAALLASGAQAQTVTPGPVPTPTTAAESATPGAPAQPAPASSPPSSTGPSSTGHDAHAGVSPSNTAVTDVVVTARRLNAAREGVQTQTGASTYTIDHAAIDAAPGGENVALNQVVLQAPGVAQDSFGQLHIRGEHGALQYRLNGVILPEGLSSFGQTLNPRLADKVQLITGALPAEYGLRTAGIVDITTRSGAYKDGGSAGVYGGSHDEVQTNAEYAGSSGSLNYFVSGDWMQSDLGIESPDGRSDPIHDHTQQAHGFAYVEDVLSENDKLSFLGGTSREQFQIPNLGSAQPSLGLSVNGRTSFPSADLNENQREITHFGVISLLHSQGKLDVEGSVFARYSSLYFSPDQTGDLLFDGIAQQAFKRDVAFGTQVDAAYHLNDAHTIRAGLLLQEDQTTSRTVSTVLPVNGAGVQTSQTPQVIPDNGGKTGYTYSVYLQDEWKLTDELTLNYGARYDAVAAYDHENQLSPRVNVVWKPLTNTTIHAGYARYFTPPPFELVGNQSVALFQGTSAASPGTLDSTPKAERANYFDLGVSQRVDPHLTLGIDSYYKQSKNLIDEGQFGAPVIQTPFNYAEGRQYGVEFSGNYANGPFSSYANLALARAQGKDITTSQFNFDPADLAYIATHYIFLDHDQTVTASAGAAYRWQGSIFSTDLIYGSGLRSDKTLADGDNIPNGRKLPNYVQVNLSASHTFDLAKLGDIEARIDIVNLFDEEYEIRDGTGVGVGAPQFGPRRGFFAGVTKSF